MKKLIAISVGVLIAINNYAESGFLSDYSLLAEIEGTTEKVYVNPAFNVSGAKYDALLIDLPEIFVSEESKYKGLKPEYMMVWAESFREALVAELGDFYNIVDQPGENVLHIQPAFSEVHLRKAKRRLLSYTPVGFVVHTAKSAIQKDFHKKISLISLTIEIEIIDSVTGEVMGMAVDTRAGNKKEPTGWESTEALMHSYGKRFKCRMDNTRQVEQVDCQQM